MDVAPKCLILHEKPRWSSTENVLPPLRSRGEDSFLDSTYRE